MPKKAIKKLRLAQRNRRKAKRMTPSQPPASLPPSPEPCATLNEIEAWVDECALEEGQIPIAKPNEIAAWVNRVKGELGRDRTLSQMVYEPSSMEGISFVQEVATKPTFWARIWRRLGQIFKRRA